MKINKFMMFAFACCVNAFLFCSCSTFTPTDAGMSAGYASYLGYARIAQDKDAEFKEKVANLWNEVNEIQSTDELVDRIDVLTIAFDEVLKNKGLTDQERAALIALKDLALSKVKVIVKSKLSSNDDAVEFLVAYRNAVNNAIMAYGPVK